MRTRAANAISVLSRLTIESKIAIGVLIGVMLVAFLGPLFAPYPPDTSIGLPYLPPSDAHLLGTDVLGRDALSRVLHGGVTTLLVATAATALAYALGITLGLLAGQNRGRIDYAILWFTDVLLAFPYIVLVLLIVAGLGVSLWVLVLAVSLASLPGAVRLCRSAVAEIATRAFVEAAIIRGASTRRILFRELLPNILPTLAADIGFRFGSIVALVAALNFLGVGLQPPSADWALMIQENRSGLSSNPYAVIIPATLISVIIVASNLAADGVTRTMGSNSSLRLQKKRPSSGVAK